MPKSHAIENHVMENHIRRGIANDIYEDSKILTFIKIWDFFDERSMYLRFYQGII